MSLIGDTMDGVDGIEGDWMKGMDAMPGALA